jgi:hypothetical protein
VGQKWFSSIWYIRRKPCTYLVSGLALSPNIPKRASNWAHKLGVLSGAFKMIFEPMVCLAQTMHLSCTDTNNVSKWTKTRFHMTHITYEFHRVRPKLFLSLRYIQCKPCTYLGSRLSLSPNGPKQAFSWALSPRRTIECVQNDFWAYGMFGANHAHILQWNKHHLQTDQNEIPDDPRHLGAASGVSETISEPMVRLAQTMHLSCNETNTVSKQTETRFQMTHVT